MPLIAPPSVSFHRAPSPLTPPMLWMRSCASERLVLLMHLTCTCCAIRVLSIGAGAVPASCAEVCDTHRTETSHYASWAPSAVLDAAYSAPTPCTNEGSRMGRVDVSNDELRSVRDAMRELKRMVDSLESGDLEKVVLCQNNRMRAVVVSLDTFSRLSGVPQAAVA